MDINIKGVSYNVLLSRKGLEEGVAVVLIVATKWSLGYLRSKTPWRSIYTFEFPATWLIWCLKDLKDIVRISRTILPPTILESALPVSWNFYLRYNFLFRINKLCLVYKLRLVYTYSLFFLDLLCTTYKTINSIWRVIECRKYISWWTDKCLVYNSAGEKKDDNNRTGVSDICRSYWIVK